MVTQGQWLTEGHFVAASDRRKREREARRQAILEAAERVMAERGLWATTMDDVATEAELSKGALYLYFDNKDALCAAMAERALISLVPRLEAAFAEAPTGLACVARAFELYADFMRGHPHLFRMALGWMLIGMQADPDSPGVQGYRQAVGQVLHHVVEAIERGRHDGSLRADLDPLTVAIQSWGGFLGVMLLELNRDDVRRRLPVPVEVERLVPLYVDHMLRSIRGPRLEGGEE